MRTTVLPSLRRLLVASVFAVSLTLLSWPASAEAQRTQGAGAGSRGHKEPPSPPSAEPESAPQGKEWRVRYIYVDWTRYTPKGLPQQVAEKMEVTLGQERIVGKTRKGAQFSIPVAQVVEVIYDTQAHNRAKGWLEAASATDKYGSERALAFTYGPQMVPYFLAVAIASRSHVTKHFVHILWRNQGKYVQDVTLEAAKGDYTSLLEELRTVTGKEWRNLPAEREKIRQEIEREKNSKTPVQLDRKVWLAGTHLNAGLYQLVLLQREENRGELYFFAGKEVNSRQVAGVAIVEIERVSGGVGAAQVNYKYDEEGNTTISEIRTPDKIVRQLVGLRLPGGPLDCGTDIACFLRALDRHQPASVRRTKTTAALGLVSTASEYMETSDFETDRCTLHFKFLKNGIVGKDNSCVFHIENLRPLLEDRNSGFSVADLQKAKAERCNGEFFSEASLEPPVERAAEQPAAPAERPSGRAGKQRKVWTEENIGEVGSHATVPPSRQSSGRGTLLGEEVQQAPSRPEERKALEFLHAIRVEESKCMEARERLCPLDDLVPEGTYDSNDPRKDANYSYRITPTGDGFEISAIPRRADVGGFLDDGERIHYNPKGPATRRDPLLK